mgnify:FL=1
MEFTKSQKDAIKNANRRLKEQNCYETANDLSYAFREVFKPETKFKDFRIEFPENESHRINARDLTLSICPTETYMSSTVKVTELPEGTWKDTDMIEFVRYFTGNDIDAIKNHFNNFKAERKSELDK